MNTLKGNITSLSKNTIGYTEAENKKSFLVGVSVSFDRTSEHYEKEIERLKKQVELYKLLYEHKMNDFKTLNKIINQYEL